MVRGAVDSRKIQELSQMVFEYETPGPVDRKPVPGGVDYSHWEAHPLVLRLAADYGDEGCAGALAYLDGGEESEVPALVRWMIAGGYKGYFNNSGDFAQAQFRHEFDTHYDYWGKAREIGFPNVTLGDMMPWDALGEALAYETPVRFHLVKAVPGVHVFDFSIDIDKYRAPTGKS